jgi:hypothetical protein
MADPVGDVCGVTPTAAAHSPPQGTPAPRNGSWHIFISQAGLDLESGCADDRNLDDEHWLFHKDGLRVFGNCGARGGAFDD